VLHCDSMRSAAETYAFHWCLSLADLRKEDYGAVGVAGAGHRQAAFDALVATI
jgi:hypothetical protein